MVYWDTSALLKLYVLETDSAYFVGLIKASSTPLLTSEIARVEIFSALARKENAGEFSKGMAEQLYARFLSAASRGSIVTVPLAADVVREAVSLTRNCYSQSVPIRSLDAIHVASAVASGAQIMVATDVRLREVAALAGLGRRPL